MPARDAAALTKRPSIVVISDFVEGWPPHGLDGDDLDRLAPDPAHGAAGDGFGLLVASPGDRDNLAVVGGYLERLPLACVRAGLVDHAEIWHHSRSLDISPLRREGPFLSRRAFRLDGETAPFASPDMLRFIEKAGAPDILCVLGLGVDEQILSACRNSVIVYNSIDAPPLRVPAEISSHFDLVLTGAEWQYEEVRARHPSMRCAVLPIGPEFADPETFRPLGLETTYDVVYVAAAQPYKRHDILFDALASAPRRLRALCVFGYGEMGQTLRDEARARGLDIDFVGPPGVSFTDVNMLMNQARIGVVCGVDDGAPAILTEYMLAGLPVLANERLACGLQFVTPATGRTAPADRFGDTLVEMLGDLDAFRPRETVLEHWTWPHTVKRFAALIAEARDASAGCRHDREQPSMRRVEH